jgi:hypothetical protein
MCSMAQAATPESIVPAPHLSAYTIPVSPTPPGAIELQDPTPGAAKTLSNMVITQGLYKGCPLEGSQPFHSCTRAMPRCPAANAASSPAVNMACCRSDLMGSPGAVPSRLRACYVECEVWVHHSQVTRHSCWRSCVLREMHVCHVKCKVWVHCTLR